VRFTPDNGHSSVNVRKVPLADIDPAELFGPLVGEAQPR